MAAPFGLGFGTGILGGLARNAQQATEDQRMEALLMGDLLGNENLLTPQERSIIPTTTEPQSALTSIGSMLAGGNRSKINSLLMLRGIIAQRAAREKEKIQSYRGILESIRKGEISDLSPAEEEAIIKDAPKPVQFLLRPAFKRVKQERAARERLFGPSGILAKGVRAGSTGAQEEGEEATDIFRPATRPEIAAAAGGIPGLEDDVARELLKRESAQRPFGSAQTGYFTMEGDRPRQVIPPAPSKTADPVMNRYRELRNEIYERRAKGTLTPKEEMQMLGAQIRVLQELVKGADPTEVETYERLLKQAFSEWNRARVKLRGSQPAQPGKPAAPTPKSGANDPLGIR